MNKIKVSMNICNNFKNVFSAGYCDLQHIFHGLFKADEFCDKAIIKNLETGDKNVVRIKR